MQTNIDPMRISQAVNRRMISPKHSRDISSGFMQALIVVALSLPSFVYAQTASDSEPRTEAAVVAADQRWDKAEDEGDTAFIESLLLPEYRSISSDGSVHDKAAIIASARKRHNSPDSAAANAKWLAAHPSLTSAVLTGDTAVLSFTLNLPGSPKLVLSSDIFVYREGHWRALYSQHSEAGK
jgi:Domain of unknown function (DUF4440)